MIEKRCGGHQSSKSVHDTRPANRPFAFSEFEHTVLPGSYQSCRLASCFQQPGEFDNYCRAPLDATRSGVAALVE